MQPISRNDKNTINTSKVVIVFLPGVMGSRLRLSGMNWDPDAGWHSLGFAKTWGFASHAETHEALSTPTSADVVMDFRTRNGIASVAAGFYSKFLELVSGHEFALATTPVFAIGYDWRISVRDSATVVKDRIEEIMKSEGAKRVILVTHSMGGLVTRAMLKQHPETQAFVAGVIHVVQPVVGATVMYRRLFTGMSKKFDSGGIASQVLGNALGVLPSEFADTVSIMPAGLLLSPTPRYSWKEPWLQVEREGFVLNEAAIFAAYGSAKSPPGVYNEGLHKSSVVKDRLDKVLAISKDFHEWIGSEKLEGKTWAIYSTGLSTDVAIKFQVTAPDQPAPKRPAGDGEPADPVPWPAWVDGLAVVPVKVDEGDGTVPENSGSALFPGQAYELDEQNTSDEAKRQFKVTDVEHGDAFKNAGVQKGVVWLIQRAINNAVAELKTAK